MMSGIKPGYAENGVSPGWSKLSVVDFILRLMAMGATFSAALVMGTDEQTVIIPRFGPLPAKYQYTPAFVFFVVVNAVACGYTALSLIFSAIRKPASSALPAFLLSVTDLVMMALVSAGASAATAIAWVGRKGNSHTHWGKICGVYDRFCHRGAVAIFSSLFGVILFVQLTVLSTYTLYRRASCTR